MVVGGVRKSKLEIFKSMKPGLYDFYNKFTKRRIKMKRLKSMIAVVACLTLLFTNVIPAMAATEEASPRVVVLQCLKCGGSITNPTVTREYLGTRWVPCTHKSGGQDLCHAYKVTVKVIVTSAHMIWGQKQ